MIGPDPRLWVGWSLFALLVLLAGYNLRKRLPFLPFFSSRAWLRGHAYGGLLSVVLFAVHTRLRLPRGAIEIALALLYLAVAGSGLAGLILSRWIPPRLALRGEEPLFERVPRLRRELRLKAEAIVLDVAEGTGVTTLADLYTRRLASFFSSAHHLGRHLLQSDAPRRKLLAELGAVDRYLDEREREAAGRLVPLVCAKDDLDYHQAHQAVLKGWLFVHVGLTLSLILTALVHGALAHVYSGALR